ANFLSKEKMIEAINYAHKMMEPFFAMQLEAQKEFGKPKRSYSTPQLDQALLEKIKSACYTTLGESFAIKNKKERGQALSALKRKIAGDFNPYRDKALGTEVGKIFEELSYKYVRQLIL